MSGVHRFGQRLEALRVHRGYSQDALTEELGLAPGTVARWECDLESPQRSQLLELSGLLRVAVDEIVGLPDSLARQGSDSNVHSLGLRRFLATAEGKRAQRSQLDDTLRELPGELTSEQYQQIASWLRAVLGP